MTLDELRARIDTLDEQLVTLLNLPWGGCSSASSTRTGDWKRARRPTSD
ncbi:MAG: hypothetical protein NDJ94_19205 [Vicinamibacteria bacterium]|nr:hypothetical protein [Vicinamibacteria bacterium]